MTMAGAHDLPGGNRSRLVVLRKSGSARRPTFHVKQPVPVDDSN